MSPSLYTQQPSREFDNGNMVKSNTNKKTLRRKRNRLGLATFASALAISVTAVGAFQSALPPAINGKTTAEPACFSSGSSSSTKLNVLADPEVFLLEKYGFAPTLEPRPMNGSQKQQSGRAVPSRVSIKSREALIGNERAINKLETTFSSSKVKGVSAAAATATVAASTTLPLRKKKNRSPRQSSTMPGFQNGGSQTDRQRSYRDGIRLVERRTGNKKLAKAMDSPEARRKRRQVNGEAMYKNSASVPDSLVHFANEIHKVDRITPKEEIELGEKTQEAIRLQNIHEDLTIQLDRAPTDEEWCAASGKINLEALSQALEDGIQAKNTLVTSNLRMVQGVVNLYIRNGLGGQYNAGDLMQEGIMALIRAAEKFDPNRGFRFSTYAMYWIRSAVKRSQIVQSRVITVPQRLYENHKRILRTEKELVGLLGRKPTLKELSEAVSMSPTQVERCVTAMNQRCFSLDQGISNTKKPMSADRSSDTLIDILDGKTDDGEFDNLKHTFLREDLIETLNRHLKPEEVELLLLRYGLRDDLPEEYGTGNTMTIASVSRIVGLKPDKVRRMINKSLKELQVIIGNEWADYEQEFQ